MTIISKFFKKLVRKNASIPDKELDDREIEILIDSVVTSSSDETIAIQLARFGEKIINKMVLTLRDSVFEIRKLASKVLDILNWEPTTDEDRSWYYIAKCDWDGVRQLEQKSFRTLITILKDFPKGTYGSLTWSETEHALASSTWKTQSEEEAVWVLCAKHKFKECTKFGSLAVAPLFSFLREEHGASEKDWRKAENALLSIGNVAVEPMIGFLDHPLAFHSAIRFLGNLRDHRATSKIIPFLDHENWEVRSTAANALGNLGDKTAIKYLKAALRHEDAIEAQNQISGALSKLS